MNTIESTQGLDDALREQVSALVDGELSRSEAAFLLKRMEHDDALKALYLRYLQMGDALRGNVEAAESMDFSNAVMRRIEAEAQVTQTAQSAVAKRASTRAGLRRWLAGAAIAATVASTALMLPEPDTDVSVVQRAAPVPPATSAPITLMSPEVQMQTVAEKSSTNLPLMLGHAATIDPMQMDEFLRLHSELQSARAPVNGAVYLVSDH